MLIDLFFSFVEHAAPPKQVPRRAIEGTMVVPALQI